MKSRRWAGASAVLACVLAAGVVSTPAQARGVTAIGIQNGSSEFSFSLTRAKVKPGLAILQYTNTGEDPHDVMIQRKGGAEILEIGEIEPGTFDRITTKLRKDSKYMLWCSLDGHREAGMEAELRVKRRN
jgi:plastocyanin